VIVEPLVDGWFVIEMYAQENSPEGAIDAERLLMME
jgi:hypothetical protein